MLREGARRDRSSAARTKRQPPTREFNGQAGATLKDSGIYAVNAVDKLHTGGFLRAFAYIAMGLDAQAEEEIARAVQLGIGPALLRKEIEQLMNER